MFGARVRQYAQCFFDWGEQGEGDRLVRLCPVLPLWYLAGDVGPFVLRYRPARHWVDVWRSIYGPLQKAFDALDAKKQAELDADLIALIEEMNAAADGVMVVPSKYFEVVVTKKTEHKMVSENLRRANARRFLSVYGVKMCTGV